MKVFTTNRRLTLVGALLASAALTLTLGSQAAISTPAPKSPTTPAASTGGSSQVGMSSATLKGGVDPHGAETSYIFQYGTTTAYGAQTAAVSAGNGTTEVKVSQPISGLPPGTTYHYRLVATSAAGTAKGQDGTFRTKSIPLKLKLAPTPHLDVFGSPFTVTGVLSGTGSADHEVALQAIQFPYLAEFANFGAPTYTNAAGAFSLRVADLSQSTQLRVTTLGPLPVYSPAITERVAVRVRIRVHPTGLRGYVRFSGTVTPAQVGARVVFQWLKPGGNPVSAGTTVVTRGTQSVSRYSSGVVLIRHGHGGIYRAFVKVLGGAQVSGYSRPTGLIHSAPAPVRKVRKARRAVAATAPKPPSANTGGSAAVSASSAALKGSVNPRGAETSYVFQYGTTTAYGTQTPPAPAGNGTTQVQVSQPIAGLQPGTIYHYRLVAMSAIGTTDGRDVAFTTKSIPLTFELAPTPHLNVFGSPFTVSGVLSGTGAANRPVALQATPFPFLGGFKNTGETTVTDAGGSFLFHVASPLLNTKFEVVTVGARPVKSPAIIERVAARVSLHVRSTGRPGFVRLSGAVEPAEVGAPVIFQLLRHGFPPRGIGGGETVVRRGATSASRFSLVVRIRRGGLYRALVQVSNGKQVSGHSRAILIR